MFCQNWRIHYHLLQVKFCPNVLAFLEPKLEEFLSLITHEMLPIFFAFLGAILEQFSITTCYLHMKFCPNYFLPFWEPKLEYFLSLMDSIYNLVQFSCLFLEPKLEDLKLFEVGCLGLSDRVKPRTSYKLFS